MDPSRIMLVASLLFATVLLVWLMRRLTHGWADRLRATGQEEEDLPLRRQLVRSAAGPLMLLACLAGLWAAARAVVLAGITPADWRWTDAALRVLLSGGAFAAGAWLTWRLTHVLDARLQAVTGRTRGRLDDIMLGLVGTGLRVMVPIVGLLLFARLLPLTPGLLSLVNKALSIGLIVGLAWVLRRGIVLVDAAVIGPNAPASPEQRALYTRVRVLRKIALALLAVFVIAGVLMTFEEVRDVGKSLLASAGVAGIVLGLAAQRSLGNLFAGLQIALTQPVRIGDQVLVEGDVGNIEEITLTYVVVRVWDQRRIVLPISYFIEKPFQNWTRVTSNMLSPLTLRMDFSLPIGELRDHLRREIERSPHWDKQVFGVQVTNADASSMEVRVLASAPDAGASFNLQCELREKAIDFVRRNYPESLPKQRREQKQLDRWWALPGERQGDGNGQGARDEAPAPPARRGAAGP
ncbi:MAG TPA: mechanosensitive ion channel domain-containing protein [Opitutaceae bacterium]|nr:mechanosensitive ion channel domain-containing protein [Opitutaceae bacterium]